MLVHQNFAYIDEDQIVQNLNCGENYEDANRLARAIFGDKGIAVDCTQWRCKIGDKYHDGVFWRIHEDGTEEALIPVPTEEQEISILKDENEKKAEEITTLQLALCDQYEANLALEEEVTNTQLALCELYEGGAV